MFDYGLTFIFSLNFIYYERLTRYLVTSITGPVYFLVIFTDP